MSTQTTPTKNLLKLILSILILGAIYVIYEIKPNTRKVLPEFVSIIKNITSQYKHIENYENSEFSFIRNINFWIFCKFSYETEEQLENERNWKQKSDLLLENYKKTLISSNFSLFFPVFIKKIYVFDEKDFISDDKLYHIIQTLNSNYLIEELADKNSLNVILNIKDFSFNAESQNEMTSSFFNPDLENEIIEVSFERLSLEKKGFFLKLVLFCYLKNNLSDRDFYLKKRDFHVEDKEEDERIDIDDVIEKFVKMMIVKSVNMLDEFNVSKAYKIYMNTYKYI